MKKRIKILFIENRYKTYFFDAIAKHLFQNGYDISWIIQNHLFIPKHGKLYKIPYPRKRDLKLVKKDKAEELKGIVSSDRQLNHFNLASDKHFFYYDQKISALLEKINPNFVFGESTAFHELITIENCKSKGFVYLNPSTCRYPTNRFSFYINDTLEPFLGSSEPLKDEVAASILEQIVNRQTQPDYMVKVRKPVESKWLDKFKILIAYYLGEKYNTPSPLIKYKKEAEKERIIRKWDEFASSKVKDTNHFKILYPLQLQPEANLDVWGRPYRNQLEVVKKILKNSEENCLLYIKPNPKSKYEINDEFISFLKEEKRVIPLNHGVKMEEVFQKMDLIITVTGTIAIECILANKPVVTLINTINNQSGNCFYLDCFNKLNGVINSIKNDKFPKLSKDKRINFLNKLNESSYPGIVSDPLSDWRSTSEENVRRIVNAFNAVLEFKNVS